MKTAGGPNLRAQLEAASNHLQSGDLPKADAAFRRVIGRDARNSAALHGLGVTLYLQQKHAEAETWLRKAIAIRAAPDFLTNLALVLAAQAKFLEAIATYRKAVKAGAKTAQVYNNLGNLLSAQNMTAEAEASFRQAIGTDAAYAIAYKNLALLLDKARRFDEAEVQFRQALALNPDAADFWLCYGGMLERLGRLPDAERAFRQARRWDSVQFLMRRCASWDGLAEVDQAAIEMISSAKVDNATPWSLLFMPSLTPTLLRQAGCRFALSRWGRELGAQACADPGAFVSAEKLKIGYLSADFYDHATMHLLAGVLERHDRRRFEVHLYSYGPQRSDAYVARIAAMPVTLHEVSGLTDRQIADAIAQERVQLLVDLKGYTTGARLGISALRPAPVTISWLGYPGTLGHPGLADFIIGDAVVTPPDCADDFSETLALMPHSYQPNDAPEELGAPPSRADAGLPEGAFVFCSFNQILKLTARSFSLWLQLLHAVPGSVLWLLKPSDDEAIRNLRKVVEASGLDAGRLVWAPRLPRRQHLARLQLADLALDTYPVTSHTTGSDALLAGVPMVARSGVLFVSRVSASLLNAIGLQDLVATTDEAYLQLALSLARDPTRLGQIRRFLSMQRRVSPLFDPRRFARDLERLYDAIWQRASGADRHSRRPIVIDGL